MCLRRYAGFIELCFGVAWALLAIRELLDRSALNGEAFWIAVSITLAIMAYWLLFTLLTGNRALQRQKIAWYALLTVYIIVMGVLLWPGLFVDSRDVATSHLAEFALYMLLGQGSIWLGLDTMIKRSRAAA